jgi:CRISPR system Cascade subunit CasE
MFLARLQLNQSRVAVNWAANPYRVHQRLRMAYPNDPRLLFRIEDLPDNGGTHIITQSHTEPDWAAAFDGFHVLLRPPEHKPFDPQLQAGRSYRFRLLANPTMKHEGKRLSLFLEAEQQAWLARKLADTGAEALGCVTASRGLQRSRKNPWKDKNQQTHFAVLFEGALRVTDPSALRAAVENGIGSAKGYGFGLLSLAPA